MLTAKLLRHTCALALFGAPLAVMAAPSTDPLFTVGLLGSYTKFKFEGGSKSDKEDMGQAGVFANFGNKMTAESGFIYQIGVKPNTARKTTTSSRKPRPTSTLAGAQRWMPATSSTLSSVAVTAGPVSNLKSTTWTQR